MRISAVILAFVSLGCAALTPSPEEVLAERRLWELTHQALEASDAINEKALAGMRDYALVQALEGNRQAVLDDTHRATTPEGLVPAAEVERLQKWLILRNREETDRIWGMYLVSRDPKSRRDLRKVLAKMEALRMARLDAEDLKMKTMEFLMGVGEDLGVVKPTKEGE